MKNMIFIEGVSGTGKTTSVCTLSEHLSSQGFSVKHYIEGDENSPLDLFRTAYLSTSEYNDILTAYPAFGSELAQNIIFQGKYILIRYQTGQTGPYSPELNRELHKYEFCYNPVNAVPQTIFTEVFLNYWTQFAGSMKDEWDYMIFDGSLVSHMSSDLILDTPHT